MASLCKDDYDLWRVVNVQQKDNCYYMGFVTRCKCKLGKNLRFGSLAN